MSFTLASSPLFFIVEKVGQLNKFSRLNDEKRKMLMCVLNENEDEMRQDCEEWDDDKKVYFEGKSNLHKLLKSTDGKPTKKSFLRRNPTSRGNFYHDDYAKNYYVWARMRYEQKILWNAEVFENHYTDFIHPRCLHRYTRERKKNGKKMTMMTRTSDDD